MAQYPQTVIALSDEARAKVDAAMRKRGETWDTYSSQGRAPHVVNQGVVSEAGNIIEGSRKVDYFGRPFGQIPDVIPTAMSAAEDVEARTFGARLEEPSKLLGRAVLSVAKGTADADLDIAMNLFASGDERSEMRRHRYLTTQRSSDKTYVDGPLDDDGGESAGPEAPRLISYRQALDSAKVAAAAATPVANQVSSSVRGFLNKAVGQPLRSAVRGFTEAGYSTAASDRQERERQAAAQLGEPVDESFGLAVADQQEAERQEAERRAVPSRHRNVGIPRVPTGTYPTRQSAFAPFDPYDHRSWGPYSTGEYRNPGPEDRLRLYIEGMRARGLIN